jgi:prevent-host-death family protein
MANIAREEKVVTSAPATDVKNRLGEYLRRAAARPVVIERNNRPVAVLLSIEEYERLVEQEDRHWGELARQAADEGFVGAEKSAEYLKKLGGAEA